MSKLVWNPKKTRDVDKSDGYVVSARQRSVPFLIENYRAWTFVVKEKKYRPTRRGKDLFDPKCTGSGFWVRKLLPCGNDYTLWNQIDKQTIPSRPTPSYTNRTELPPELFKYICQGSDRRSTSSRLVCKYWEQQCRPFVFAEITLRRSPQRARDLLDITKDPACRIVPHAKSITGIPAYTSNSSFPFLHLPGQTGIPLDETIIVKGPFGKGHRTIRSIHFAIPRSLPSFFSRGIRSLSLEAIHFQRYEDLMSLVSELPDLEELLCGSGWASIAVTFGSYPTERLPRRPRRSRNSLKRVYISRIPAGHEKKLPPRFYLLALYPFLAVYDSASFFDEREIAVICASLQDVMFQDLDANNLDGTYKYDPETKSRMYQFRRRNQRLLFVADRDLSFAFQTRPDSTIIYYNANGSNVDLVSWRQVAAACRSLSRPPQFVIGVEDRRNLLDFNANIVEKMPSLCRPGTVKYSLKRADRWFLTSLDSKKLKLEGEGKRGFMDVYP